MDAGSSGSSESRNGLADPVFGFSWLAGSATAAIVRTVNSTVNIATDAPMEPDATESAKNTNPTVTASWIGFMDPI